MATTPSLPSRARVVVIGGGVIGTSVAYHLAHLGVTDVVLLERHQLTSGTTWHAAGLIVAGGFHSETYLEMFKHSRHLYRDVLEAETEQATGYSEVGYLQVAATKERAEAQRRDARFQALFGLDSHEVGPSEIAGLWPPARHDDLERGFFYPDQGRANPADVTMAFAKGARRLGVRIVEGVAVTGVRTASGRTVSGGTAGAHVTGVVTDQGEIEAEHVVNCAGLWGRAVGRLAGVDLPLQAAEHYYVITEPIAGVERTLPILEDPDRHGYFREETGGLMVGLFEPVARAWSPATPGGFRSPPTDVPFATLEPDWDRIVPFAQRAMERIPVAADAGIRTFFCGPESFVPDLNPLIGEAPNLRNFWVACGLNSLGILLGGGVGQLLAQWIVDGEPPTDVVEIDPARLSPHQNSSRYLEHRIVESLGVLFGDAAWPNYSFTTARGGRRSPVHDRLAAAGAHFVDVVGWEYPEWFAPLDDSRPNADLTWGRAAWWSRHEAEHRAVREAVGLIDLTFMGKFWVEGADAARFLGGWAAADIERLAVGACRYTVALDDRGRIRADITITRHAADRFMVVCGPETITRTEAWLRRHLAPELRVVVTDVTSAFTILNLQGPRSRDLLARITDADLTAAAFPYQSMRTIDVHYARVHAQRMTYSGELGFELFVPAEFGVSVFDAIVAAGDGLGLRLIGLATLESLRMEKANRDYTHDVDNFDTPIEVGLMFTVDLDAHDFRGRDAIVAAATTPPVRRLVQVALEDPAPLLYGGEPVLRDGRAVGYVRTGAYGHTLGRSVGLAMLEPGIAVTKAWIESGTWACDVNDTRVAATLSLRPRYDPTGERPRS